MEEMPKLSHGIKNLGYLNKYAIEHKKPIWELVSLINLPFLNLEKRKQEQFQRNLDNGFTHEDNIYFWKEASKNSIYNNTYWVDNITKMGRFQIKETI